MEQVHACNLQKRTHEEFWIENLYHIGLEVVKRSESSDWLDVKGCSKGLRELWEGRWKFGLEKENFVFVEAGQNYQHNRIKRVRLKFVGVTFTFAEVGQRQIGEKSFVQPLGLFSHSQVLGGPFDQNKAFLDSSQLQDNFSLWLQCHSKGPMFETCCAERRKTRSSKDECSTGLNQSSSVYRSV